MEDDTRRRASMDHGSQIVKPMLQRAMSSRDGMVIASGSPVSRQMSNASSATLRAENAAHRLNHNAMRELLAEAASLPPETCTDTRETTARRILHDVIGVLDVGDRMLLDVRRNAVSGKSVLRQDSSGRESSLASNPLGAAARGLLLQYSPRGFDDTESFQNNARLAAAAYDAVVVRRAVAQFKSQRKGLRLESPSKKVLSATQSPQRNPSQDMSFKLARAEIEQTICSWTEFDAIGLSIRMMEGQQENRMHGASGEGDVGEVTKSLKGFDIDHDVAAIKSTKLASGILRETTYAAMEYLDIFTHVPEIKRDNVKAFLKALEQHYASPEYHSATHAADVVQAVLFILGKEGGGLASRLEPFQAFTLLIAAASHDVGHPGLNNVFLTSTEHPSAVRWNDVSVNENGHLHTCLGLLKTHGVFEGLSEDNKRQCKQIIGRLILSTDMAHHTKLVEEFVDVATNAIESCASNERCGRGIDERGELTTETQKETESSDDGSIVKHWPDPTLALCYVLHCADISNPARPWQTAREWGRRVTEEFYKQGDHERLLGVPVSVLNDRDAEGDVDKNTAANQAAFLEYVVEPTLAGLAAIAPAAVEVMMANLTTNRLKYQKVIRGEEPEE